MSRTGAIDVTDSAASWTRSRPVRRPRPGQEDEGEEGADNRTGGGGCQREDGRDEHPSSLCRHERAEGDGQAEGERQPTDRHVGDGAHGEPHRRQRAAPSGALAEQHVGQEGRGAGTGDGHGPDPDERSEHGEQHAVAECVVAAVPEVVPDLEAVALDDGDAEEVRREVRTPPPQDDGDERQRRRDGRREQRRGSAVATRPAVGAAVSTVPVTAIPADASGHPGMPAHWPARTPT